MKVLGLTLFCLLLAGNEAKVFGRCELAAILKQAGMNEYHGVSLANWICTAYYESGFNSGAVGPPNKDGSRDYGIFQLNSRYWCNNHQGKTANECRVSCSAFTDNNIRDDIECAKKVARESGGMGAWVAWKNHCRGKDVSKWTSGCKF